jgi:hypothetical protein
MWWFAGCHDLGGNMTHTPIHVQRLVIEWIGETHGDTLTKKVKTYHLRLARK